MNITLFIYLANVLPALGQALTILGLVGALVAGFFFMPLFDEGEPKHWAVWRKCVTGVVAVFAVAVLIPSERTMYLMAGASVVQKAIESPEMQTINSKVLAIINSKLDEYVTKEKK